MIVDMRRGRGRCAPIRAVFLGERRMLVTERRLIGLTAVLVLLLGFHGQVIAATGADPGSAAAQDAQAMANPPNAGGTQPSISGTFLQLSNALARYSEAEWAQELDWMQEVGIELIIIQYAGYGNSWWYPRTAGTPDLIGLIMSLAEERDMQVMLGLHLDPAFWEGTHDMATEVERNRSVASQLWERYGARPSFAGWYIPHELSDHTFRNAREYLASIDLHSQLAQHLRALAPQVPISVAPYYGGTYDERSYGLMWGAYLNSVDVDIIMLQDGVGTHRVGIDDIAPHFRALRNAIGQRPIALWSDVEIFDQIHGWPVDDEPWAATTGAFDRIRAQMEAAEPYVTRLVIFEFSHYMSPRTPEATALFEAYRSWVSELSVSSPAITPAVQ